MATVPNVNTPSNFQKIIDFVKTHIYVLIPVVAVVVYFLLPKSKTKRR